MGVVYNKENKVFHLNAANTSYAFKIFGNGEPVHLYWGRKITKIKDCQNLFLTPTIQSPRPDQDNAEYSYNNLLREYPGYGDSDFRYPAYQVQTPYGDRICSLKYFKHEIQKGKNKLDGLPSLYSDNKENVNTLKIYLNDEVTRLKAVLSYSVFEKYDVITRSVKFENTGKDTLKLLSALSASVDFRTSDFDIVHLAGRWGNERDIERHALRRGTQSIESRRGASSHQHNPFFALASKDTTEYWGQVYAFNLIYSGNFLANIEVDQFLTTRAAMGINPFDFSWNLEPGESFQTPELVMVYSDMGFSKMSNTFHKLYRNCLCRSSYRNKIRPVLVNNWEATYFDFNEEKIMAIVKKGKDLGIEMFVLDDGWFGMRNDDKSSLGDWFVDKRKFKNGLSALSRKIKNEGMKFGLWFEPEMISPNSDLYKKNPNWCLHVPARHRSESRNQLILDLSRIEVCDYIIERMSDILSNCKIDYVKWDCNRFMSEIGSAKLPPERQMETAHRFVLGLYYIMDKITGKFDKILFEGCAGGGGRFDPGILHYMPQYWTSDNTDAISRLRIQYGTSMVYPISTMGAHVSAVPNHQTGRVTTLATRGNVAMNGVFGYELDITNFSSKETEIVKEQINRYKEIRKTVLFGDFYRLKSPFKSNEAAWMFMDKDKLILFHCSILREAIMPIKWIKLKGLNENTNYKLKNADEIYRSCNVIMEGRVNYLLEDTVFSGGQLMYAGLPVPSYNNSGDFQSYLWIFEKIFS